MSSINIVLIFNHDKKSRSESKKFFFIHIDLEFLV
jgi:hypothetical protein